MWILDSGLLYLYQSIVRKRSFPHKISFAVNGRHEVQGSLAQGSEDEAHEVKNESDMSLHRLLVNTT